MRIPGRPAPYEGADDLLTKDGPEVLPSKDVKPDWEVLPAFVDPLYWGRRDLALATLPSEDELSGAQKGCCAEWHPRHFSSGDPVKIGWDCGRSIAAERRYSLPGEAKIDLQWSTGENVAGGEEDASWHGTRREERELLRVAVALLQDNFDLLEWVLCVVGAGQHYGTRLFGTETVTLSKAVLETVSDLDVQFRFHSEYITVEDEFYTGEGGSWVSTIFPVAQDCTRMGELGGWVAYEMVVSMEWDPGAAAYYHLVQICKTAAQHCARLRMWLSGDDAQMTTAAVMMAAAIAHEFVHVAANKIQLGDALDDGVGGIPKVCNLTYQVDSLLQALLLERYPLGRASDCGSGLPSVQDSFFVGRKSMVSLLPADCGSDDECRTGIDKDGALLWPATL